MIIKTSSDALPFVSLFIPAYNEEKVIKTKINNSLGLQYPQNKIEIVVASDGSTDDTNKIASTFGDQITFFEYSERGGKTNLINKTIPKLNGEIIIFSDASAILEQNALHKLIRHFRDDKIGCVSGQYKLGKGNSTSSSTGESIYWRYETTIKSCESKFYSILGAHGALYAIRAELFEPLPPNAINDDYILPMLAVKHGFRAIYEEKAIANEIVHASIKGEVTRRRRISVGNFQQLFILKSLLNPFRGKIAFEFISHKLLRSFAFVFMVLLFLLNLFLHTPLFLSLLIFQIFFYVTGLLMYLFKIKECRIKLFTIPFYIFIINYSSYLGFVEFLKGNEETLWEKSTN